MKGPNEKLEVPQGNITIAAREVWVEWQEAAPPSTHQLDLGEKPPTVTHRGVVVQYLWTYELFRSGFTEGKVQAVILDEKRGKLVMKPFPDIRVAPLGGPVVVGPGVPMRYDVALDVPAVPASFVRPDSGPVER